MIQNQSTLDVILARGGSKGVSLKNLRTVGGLSLVAWAGDVIAKVAEIDRALVSTDHEGIAALFRRPDLLFGDREGTWVTQACKVWCMA